jgi:hypothetical protein
MATTITSLRPASLSEAACTAFVRFCVKVTMPHSRGGKVAINAIFMLFNIKFNDEESPDTGGRATGNKPAPGFS